jgi:hypothetical protein
MQQRDLRPDETRAKAIRDASDQNRGRQRNRVTMNRIGGLLGANNARRSADGNETTHQNRS